MNDTYPVLLARARRKARKLCRRYDEIERLARCCDAITGDHGAPAARAHLDAFIEIERSKLAIHRTGGSLDDDARADVMALWRDLDDLCRFEAHMFCQFLYVLNAVIGDGTPIPPLPHAHIATTSRDCDGRMEHDWIVPLRQPGHPDGEFGTRDLVRDYLPIVDGITLHVRDLDDTIPHGFEDHGGNLIAVEWSQPTDEGFHAMHIRGCLDRCDLDEHGQRDHTAESMGY